MDKKLKIINIVCIIVIILSILTIIAFKIGTFRVFKEKIINGKIDIKEVNNNLYNKYAYYNDNIYYIDKIDNKYYLYRYNITYNTYREITRINTSSDNYAINAIDNYIIIFEINDNTNVYIYNTSTNVMSTFEADSIFINNRNLYYTKYDSLYLLYLESSESGYITSTKNGYSLEDNVINVKSLDDLKNTTLSNMYVYDGNTLYLKNDIYIAVTTLDNIDKIYSVTKVGNILYVVTENVTYIYNGNILINTIDINYNNVISLNDGVLFKLDNLYYFNGNDLSKIDYNDTLNIILKDKKSSIVFNTDSNKYYLYHNNELVDLQNISGTVLTSLVDSIDTLFIKDNKLYYNNMGQINYIIDLG